jgi:MYXO-CTERM domain-containing protein
MNFQTMDMEAFHEATAAYRVLRISRQSPRTGTDGPASLAWLWPLIFIFLLLRGRRRK